MARQTKAATADPENPDLLVTVNMTITQRQARWLREKSHHDSTPEPGGRVSQSEIVRDALDALMADLA